MIAATEVLHRLKLSSAFKQSNNISLPLSLLVQKFYTASRLNSAPKDLHQSSNSSLPVSLLQVQKFYTAPTLIRALMREGDEHVKGCDKSSLQVLGTVGEPINPEAWKWYHRVSAHLHNK